MVSVPVRQDQGGNQPVLQEVDCDVQQSCNPTMGENDCDEGPEEDSKQSRLSKDMTAVPGDGQTAQNVKSVASSIILSLIIIPRGQRRGLLARFTIVPEVQNPYLYEKRTKWLLTFFIALAAGAGPAGSAILMPALPQLAADLNTSPKITNLAVAMYMLSIGIFPLWWSSFSETYGRRSIYLISFALFTLWSVASALSTSIEMLIVMRVLAGGASASVQAVGAGSIADMWEVRERGKAMGIFYLGPLLGPLLAPIIGGVLAQVWNWRSTQWFLAIYGGILFILLTFFLPETLAASTYPATTTNANEKAATRPEITRTSTRQSVHKKTKKAGKIFKRCIIDPLSVLLYLRFPAVLLTVYLASITFGVLYILNISVQQTFSQQPYGYPVIIIGLLYIPMSLGYVLASLLGGRWTDHIMAREAVSAGRYDSKGKLIYRPEDRMRENAWIAAAVFPGALIWYGWTVQKGVIWIVPMIANFFFGFGSMIIFGAATTMLTEFMPKKSSSGVAVNNFLRNIFSCTGGVVANPLIDVLGNGWLFTGLGCICWISAFGVVWGMRRFGPRWRIVMDEKLNT